MRQKGRELDAAYRQRSDRGIEERLYTLTEWRDAQTVLIYMSVGFEPQTRGIIREGLRRGKKMAVPRCLRGGIMEARQILSLDGLAPDRFGIPAPARSALLIGPAELDLVLAPCAAADPQGVRLGNGGGYYDRYLEKVNCPVVCLCRHKLLADVLPREKHDRLMDIVLTEEEAFS